MTLPEALDYVIGLTKHGRYRDLCDPGHPAFDPDMTGLILEMAEGRWTPPPPDPPTREEVLARRAAKPRIPLGQPHRKGTRP